MFDGVDYSSSASEGLMEVESSSSISTKRKRSKNKRRFRDEQIRCLELMFESDTKLEPRKKAHLAKELGLQPRQIAIWFQNKRARWKSKQIEKDYTLLLSDYNNLSSQFESLKKENHSLSLQLEKLKNEMSGNAEEKTQYEIQQSSDGEQKIDFEALISDEDSSMLLLGLDREMVEPGSLTSSEDWGSDDLIIQPTGWWDFWG